jgi:V/A-type H+/Na+-transporting ATPase subunit D
MRGAKNKTAQLELKQDLDVILNGAQILEEKRNILLKEIMTLLDEVEAQRRELNHAVKAAYRELVKALMESGKKQLKKEAKLPVFRGRLHVYEKSFVGILTPQISYSLEQVRSPLDLGGETLFLETARMAFVSATEGILALAEIEFKAWRLADELKKTVVRVNALQKFYVPEYREAIKETAAALEEGEREFLTLVKRASGHFSRKS